MKAVQKQYNKHEDAYKLENQLCFPLYAASRLVTKCYQPVLDELGITYPQYLVLMVLWEQDQVSLSVLAEKLMLQSNTLTPLLKRMQETGLIDRVRSQQDERSIVISLTDKGRLLKAEVPRLQQQLQDIGITFEEAVQLKKLLSKMLRKAE
ncbi:DNA-binding MarR family transcriptional regulator [Filimonas zeae]|uniref:HTH-type transcriptional regulator SarZ n=1 Tax=Filimonas zeae TaxID=1737353 RepID=A0A917ITB2_9BACT|nr:MarR family transcriptional regulator [Filimonas zeae]MDR6338332.1 DNA-binding MarR family transcriptional regulator [Filimonas zeae]GGH62887.1 MarR family transcriptional regulator [Filimonas zeae]